MVQGFHRKDILWSRDFLEGHLMAQGFNGQDI